MDREDIIRMAREVADKDKVDPYLNEFVVLTPEELERFAALVADAEREKLAAWMMSQGYATGHGDSIEKLLEELEWQIEERIAAEREACASICFQEGPSIDGELIAEAIRARGNK
jgi:hypothetical protein